MKKFLPALLILTIVLVINIFYIYAYTGIRTISLGNAIYSIIHATVPATAFFSLIYILSKCYSTRLGKKVNLITLTTISFTYLIITFIEVANIKVTLVPFYETFWDLFNITFLVESLKSYPIPSLIGSILIIILTAIICIFIKIGQSKKADTNTAIKAVLVISMLSILITYSPIARCIKSFAEYQLTKDARKINYTNKLINKEDITVEVTNPKNVVHIILESFADSFTNNEKYPNLTPKLNELTKQGIYLNNLKQLKYSTYSEAGNFIASRGRMHFNSINLENDISTTYILKKAGYTNVFMRGATQQAGGPLFMKTYSKQQGIDEYITYETLNKNYDKSRSSNWGLEDSALFEQALNKYKELQNTGNPFYLGLFTLDTHAGQKQSIECTNKTYTETYYKIKVMKSVNCADTLITRFINKLKQLPNFENTLIIIHADHMPYFLEKDGYYNDNKMFGLLLNFDKSFEQNKPTYLFDIPTTIINNAGIKTNAQFLLGEDISDKNFIRTQKTVKPFDNKKVDLKLNDYSTDFNIYRSILRFYQ
tara:strand:+ start:682 stop:2298 length:1617 start_codon:yes stop_codon:yes gene_type:complete